MLLEPKKAVWMSHSSRAQSWKQGLAAHCWGTFPMFPQVLFETLTRAMACLKNDQTKCGNMCQKMHPSDALSLPRRSSSKTWRERTRSLEVGDKANACFAWASALAIQPIFLLQDGSSMTFTSKFPEKMVRGDSGACRFVWLLWLLCWCSMFHLYLWCSMWWGFWDMFAPNCYCCCLVWMGGNIVEVDRIFRDVCFRKDTS